MPKLEPISQFGGCCSRLHVAGYSDWLWQSVCDTHTNSSQLPVLPVADHAYFLTFWNPCLMQFNPLTPGDFPKQRIFETFLTFKGLLSAKIASNHSKWPLQCGTRPCLSLERCLTTFLLGHAQKSKFWDSFWMINHPTTLGFSFFFFFFRSSIFSSYLFAAVVSLLPGFFWVEEFPSKR